MEMTYSITVDIAIAAVLLVAYMTGNFMPRVFSQSMKHVDRYLVDEVWRSARLPEIAWIPFVGLPALCLWIPWLFPSETEWLIVIASVLAGQFASIIALKAGMLFKNLDWAIKINKLPRVTGTAVSIGVTVSRGNILILSSDAWEGRMEFEIPNNDATMLTMATELVASGDQTAVFFDERLNGYYVAEFISPVLNEN